MEVQEAYRFVRIEHSSSLVALFTGVDLSSRCPNFASAPNAVWSVNFNHYWSRTLMKNEPRLNLLNYHGAIDAGPPLMNAALWPMPWISPGVSIECPSREEQHIWTALKKPYSKILDKRKLLGLEMSFKSSFKSGPPADYGDTARQR